MLPVSLDENWHRPQNFLANLWFKKPKTMVAFKLKQSQFIN